MQFKKLTSKKFKVFGKQISVLLVVAIAVMGFAAAALAGYLSGMVTGNVTVNSPMELQIGSAWNSLSAGPLNLGSIHGGETVDVYVSTVNHANVAITGTMSNVISNPSGVTCLDFQSLAAQVLDMSGNVLVPSALISCQDVDSTHVKLITTPTTPYTWAAGHSDIAHVTATFKTDAYGAYTLSTQVLP